MGGNTMNDLMKAIEIAEARRNASIRDENLRDRALRANVCPSCTGVLKDESKFLDSFFSRIRKKCSQCGAEHLYYLGDD
jgi:uncharacterized protein (DUF983 family)